MLGLDLPTLISRLIILFISLPLHEFAHAYTANAFGDDTPRSYGRLTLNPLRHLDVFGSLMIILVGFGWAKPVPVNPYALQRRTPSALMWVSLAGPMTNFLLAVLAVIPFRLGLIHPTAAVSPYLPTPYNFLMEFIVINLLLMLFNLIPLAPLDGDKIADYFFPPSWSRFMEKIRPYGPIILMLLVFVLPRVGIDLFGWILYPALYNIMTFLGVPL